MWQRSPILITLALAAAACADAGLSEPDSDIEPLAERYLADALDVMQFNSVRRHEIDWPAFREATLSDASGARFPSDAHAAIVAALERLGDGHSFFVSAGSSPLHGPPGTDAAMAAAMKPSARLIAPGVGYIAVPAYSGGGPAGDAIASEYHALIESVDTLGPVCRWMVDLRGNTGGNMWPMVAGLGPLMGEDAVGFFVDADARTSVWFYGGGQAGLDDDAIAEAATPYALTSPLPQVAVLTDGRTASSGEAVAVAFRGLDRARSFGEPTWGVSTANAAFPLLDGSAIFLTVATMVDRVGTVYGAQLEPDEIVLGGDRTGDLGTDSVLRAALEWLNSQACW